LIWNRLTAVFGKLDNHTLLIKEGFNLIYAPNESGKSTWCAFLRTMLYGFPARDRKPTADKVRYLPWNGKPPEGRIDLTANGNAITLTRRTLNPSIPMGSFSAYFTGTGTSVPNLSSSNCGELLTGVPREVFERSAFIRQNSMVISQDAELERRIATLITSGEEDTSFSETLERLKKQLHKRRYHKTGLLPTLENEILSLTQQLQRSQALHQQLAQTEQNLSFLEQQEEQLLRQLTEAAASAQTDTHREFNQLQQQAEQADALVRARSTEISQLPPRKMLATLKSAAGNILVNQLTLRSLQAQTELRTKERQNAQAALDSFPLFSGLTGEQARQQAQGDASRWQKLYRGQKMLLLISRLLPILALAIGITVFLLKLPPIALIAAAAPLLLCPVFLVSSRSQRRKADILLAPYGNSEDCFSAQAEQYYIIYSKFLACRGAEEDAHNRQQKLENDLSHSLEQIILHSRVLNPGISDLVSATTAIDRAIAVWTQFETAKQEQERIYARCETLSAILGDSQPEQQTDILHSQLQTLRHEIQNERRQHAALHSQLQLCGSPEALAALLGEKKQQHASTQREYDAISTALHALTAANTTLQNRFSPELGKKAAKYFAKLTKGKYNNVLLNRDLEASVSEADFPTSHPFHQLSQGTAEQLYLAIRLAICDLVLPEENAVPLVLDDALSAFDDERMEAALDVLMEVSENRQILFFTCQKREADYLRRAYPERFFYTEL